MPSTTSKEVHKINKAVTFLIAALSINISQAQQQADYFCGNDNPIEAQLLKQLFPHFTTLSLVMQESLKIGI